MSFDIFGSISKLIPISADPKDYSILLGGLGNSKNPVSNIIQSTVGTATGVIQSTVGTGIGIIKDVRN